MRWLVVLSLFCVFAVAVARDIVVSAPDALLFNGVAMAPARPLAELLGVTISVEGNAITLTRQGKAFTCIPGQRMARANGADVLLPLPSFTRVEVAYVPLRACIEALGGTVIPAPLSHEVLIMLPELPTPLRLPLVPQPGIPAHYRDDDQEIFLIGLDGAGLRRLTYNTRHDTLPDFSPDGEQMVWSQDYTLTLRPTSQPVGFITQPPSPRADQKMGMIARQFSPEGRELLFQAIYYQGTHITDDTIRETCVALLHLDDLHVTVLAPGLPYSFSPDGRRILYETADGTLALMDRDGRRNRLIAPGVEFPSFSADGTMVSFYLDATLMHAPVASVERGYTAAIDFPHGEALQAIISPDGRQAAFLRNDAPRGIYLMDLDRGNAQLLADGPDVHKASLLYFSPDGAVILFATPRALWSLHADGSPRLLARTTRPVTPDEMRFTPDGRHLLFVARPEIAAWH